MIGKNINEKMRVLGLTPGPLIVILVIAVSMAFVCLYPSNESAVSRDDVIQGKEAGQEQVTDTDMEESEYKNRKVKIEWEPFELAHPEEDEHRLSQQDREQRKKELIELGFKPEELKNEALTIGLRVCTSHNNEEKKENEDKDKENKNE